MNEQKIPSGKIKIDTESLKNQLVNVSEVHLNVSQDFIITTEDKVRLCLSEHLKRMEMKRSWMAPFGIFIAILVTFITSTFKDAGLSADTWRAIFIIVGILSFVRLVWSIIEALKSEKIDDIVEQLKKDLQSKAKSILKKEIQEEKPKIEELTVQIIEENIKNIIQKLKKEKPIVGNYFEKSKLENVSNNTVHYTVANSLSHKMLEDNTAIISVIFSNHFNLKIRVEFLLQKEQKEYKF
ncbi:MAG: hypothetical protein KAU01_03275 [Candidatus Cloacimonetes bacterium]|nr:hypothetical protein [Candidatus Cloacimonadota bacterium]